MLNDLNSPAVYEDGGLVFYRASSLGGCKRMLALARQGYEPVPPPANMLEVFKAGQEAEEQAFVKGLVHGLRNQLLTLEVSRTIRVVGHPDAWDLVERRPHEVKSQVRGEFEAPIETSLMWPRYKFQIGVYMHAAGNRELYLHRVLRNKAGDVLDHKMECYTHPPVSLAEIRQRVFEVETLAKKDLTGLACDAVQFPCPYFYTHVDTSGLREYVDDSGAVVLAKEYKAASTAARVAKEKVAVTRRALVDWLGDKDRVDLPDGWKVTKYKVEGRRVEYDSKGYEAIRVTEPKEKDGEP